MRYKKHLLTVILIALVLRIAPVALYGMPASYDAPFHVRNAEFLLGIGNPPGLDYALGGQPNNYPPFYHLLLASLSALSGIGAMPIAALLLPLFAALVPLTVFLLVARISDARGGQNERHALYAAFAAAVATPLVAAAFDSPENMVFFALPLVLLLAQRRSHVAAGLLYASFALWNYFAVIATIVPLLVAYRKQRRLVGSAVLGIAAALLFSLAVHGLEFFENVTISAGMAFVASDLAYAMPVIAAASAAVALVVLLFALQGKQPFTAGIFFCAVWLCISILGVVSFAFTNVFRPWEHPKFLALAAMPVLFGVAIGNNAKKFAFFLIAVMLLLSVLLSFQVIFPRVTATDFNAISFLSEKTSAANSDAGTILAAPSLSEYIAVTTDLDSLLLTSLHFESARSAQMLEGALLYLMHRSPDEHGFVRKNNLRYIILNFEDAQARGISAFSEKPYLDRVYTLGYYRNCTFAFIPKSLAYACYGNETVLLRVNE